MDGCCQGFRFPQPHIGGHSPADHFHPLHQTCSASTPIWGCKGALWAPTQGGSCGPTTEQWFWWPSRVTALRTVVLPTWVRIRWYLLVLLLRVCISCSGEVRMLFAGRTRRFSSIWSVFPESTGQSVGRTKGRHLIWFCIVWRFWVILSYTDPGNQKQQVVFIWTPSHRAQDRPSC